MSTNLLSLIDLCRAYDALGHGTPIVKSENSPVAEAIRSAILSRCTAIAAETSGQVSEAPAPAPAAPAPTAPVAPKVEAAPVAAPAVKVPDAGNLDFSVYLERFMAVANTRPDVVKPVLHRYGVDRGASVKPEDRLSVITELEAAANG
jgi:hypothetical protein